MFYFLKNGANFLKRRQEDVLSAAFVIAFSVALSRILGLVRYRLLASYFGDNIQLLDSFIAASILPEAIFEVLIFGTIALAFIPVFSQYLSREKLEKAWRLSSTMITLGLFAFAVLAILILALANFIAPNYDSGAVFLCNFNIFNRCPAVISTLSSTCLSLGFLQYWHYSFHNFFGSGFRYLRSGYWHDTRSASSFSNSITPRTLFRF